MPRPARIFGPTVSTGRLDDIFELQDQVTSQRRRRHRAQGEQAEIERAKRKPTENLDAYDYFLRGMAVPNQWTRESNIEATQTFRKAIELDPEFASAYRYGCLVLLSSEKQTDG